MDATCTIAKPWKPGCTDKERRYLKLNILHYYIESNDINILNWMIIELVIQSVMMCIDHVDYKFKFFIQIKSMFSDVLKKSFLCSWYCRITEYHYVCILIFRWFIHSGWISNTHRNHSLNKSVIPQAALPKGGRCSIVRLIQMDPGFAVEPLICDIEWLCVNFWIRPDPKASLAYIKIHIKMRCHFRALIKSCNFLDWSGQPLDI